MDTEDVVFDSKLIPILREGVEVVKMILFLKLKEHVADRRQGDTKEYQLKLVGATLNDIFGTVHPEERFQEFARKNKQQIEQLSASIPEQFQELLIVLTDALRTSVLCDYQEGVDRSQVLVRAQEKELLLVDRDLPMPHRFIELVRRLGASFGLVVPPEIVEDKQ